MLRFSLHSLRQSSFCKISPEAVFHVLGSVTSLIQAINHPENTDIKTLGSHKSKLAFILNSSKHLCKAQVTHQHLRSHYVVLQFVEIMYHHYVVLLQT